MIRGSQREEIPFEPGIEGIYPASIICVRRDAEI